ncbi:MAG: hypothetical protein JNK87_33315 [Bryobacterales bacterium]|nr:hypothetical protein [Bryobacterales bacterium]
MRHLVVWLCVLPAFGQPAGCPEQTSSALLQEVRQLRQTLERSALLTPRITILLQRIYTQQSEVSSLRNQLEMTRESMTRMAQPDLLLPPPEVNLPPDQRKLIEENIKQQKAQMERELQAQRLKETELAAKLHTEEGRLQEWNDRLETLERMLGEPGKP